MWIISGKNCVSLKNIMYLFPNNYIFKWISMKSSHSTQFNLYKVVDDTYRIDFEQVCHFGLPTSARIRGNLTVHSIVPKHGQLGMTELSQFITQKSRSFINCTRFVWQIFQVIFLRRPVLQCAFADPSWKSISGTLTCCSRPVPFWLDS